MLFANVNILAVIVGAVINMALGFLWYSKALFGKQWMAAMGKTEDQLGSPGPGYALTTLGAIVSSFTLALIVNAAGSASLLEGALTGLTVAIGLIATAFAAEYIFADRGMKLYLINAGYHVVAFTLVGALFGVWR